MSRLLVVFCLSLALAAPASAGLSQEPVSWQHPPTALPRVVMPPVDVARLLQEDHTEGKPGPYRFAHTQETLLTLENSGTWETLPDGSHLWRLRFVSPGALSLNVAFTRWLLPPSGRVWIYAHDGTYAEGPYSALNENQDGQFWSPVVQGDDVVVELHLAASDRHRASLTIGRVHHGYRYFFESEAQPQRSHGGCNNDVICPVGNPWRDQIRSAAVYSLGGSRICSGQMVNNTSGDYTPYFLSANHCGISNGNAGSLVVYWNYEAPSCGQQTGGSLSNNQSGSTRRAAFSSSDFVLVELNQMPNPAWDVYWSGWNRSGSNPSGAVAIHHPSTHVKSISFDNNPLTPRSYLSASGNDGTHWRVGNWEDGTTEGGSSGSGIWDPADGLLVGQLHGGYASCSSNTSDWYGRFDRSWSGGGSQSNRLRDWLDPTGSGVTTLPGGEPGANPPGAAFSGSPRSGNAPLQVAFTDQSTGSPTSWSWTFGDGGSSSQPNPSHTYQNPGTYTVSLTVTNTSGSDTETKTNYISVSQAGTTPIADFSGTPTSGVAPLTVDFTDLSSNAPTGWGWYFGDGGSSNQQNPTHTYQSPGIYDVTMSCANVFGTDTITKTAYIQVTAQAVTEEIVTGSGAGPGNAPEVRFWDHASPPNLVGSFGPYGSSDWGTNVAMLDVIGGGQYEVVTGPGPGPLYGPQIRGFTAQGTVLSKLNFYGYGTLRYGAQVAGGDIEPDGHHEIVTSPGPGAVFGPHQRGWNYDGTSLSPITRINFFSNQTLRFGARNGAGDLDGDGSADLLTGAGAGAVFAPHVRAWDVSANPTTPMPVNLFAFTSGTHGAAVSAGDLDADGRDSIVAVHGPDGVSSGEVAVFDLTGGSVSSVLRFTAFSNLGGAEPAAGDLDADGADDLVIAIGWGAANPTTVRAFGPTGSQLPGQSFNAFPGQSYGAKVAVGDTGTP